VEETFWLEKYNIQLIQADADEFLNQLKETWISQNHSVLSFEARKSKEYLQADEATRFPRFAESFYQVRPADCTGTSNAKLFFRGSEPSWADIRDKVAPRRDAYWTLLETLFPELGEPNLPTSLYLVTGAAGTGKTTLIHSIAYDLANEFDLPVLVHIPGTPLDARFLGSLVNNEHLQRIIVIVHHAAEYIRPLERFVDEVKQKSLPVTIFLEERKNQWNVASSATRSRLAPATFELSALSQDEINNILAALTKYNALGKLTDSAHSYQVEHFTALAHKELLVGLRELTSEASFDDIIRDEFNMIPSEVGKNAYVYVAALGQMDLAIRYETLVNILALRYDQLGTEVFRPTEGVLISGEVTGNSRHNAGFRLTTRYPVIASIIFAMVAPDDDAKFDIFNNILTQMDQGFHEDRVLLSAIVRRRELVDTLASHEKRRAFYDRLAAILPNDPYVFQHRSILERDLYNPRLAVEYARKASRLESSNPAFLNTLGIALEFAARYDNDPLRRHALLSEASKIFDDGIRRNPTDPCGYIGKVYIMRQSIEREQDSLKKSILQADALSLLEDAYEATSESSVVVNQLALQRKQLGTPEEAIDVLKIALARDPINTRLRDLWIRLEVGRKRLDEALRIAEEGTTYDPTSWRFQRHIARIKKDSGGSIEAVKGHYEAAIRHHKGDVSLMIELGAYLFMNGMYTNARVLFSEARDLPISSFEKQKIREWWKDMQENELIFQGKVSSIRGLTAYAISIPGNFEVFFWRSRSNLSDLREGDPIGFKVGFNAYGSVAHIL